MGCRLKDGRDPLEVGPTVLLQVASWMAVQGIMAEGVCERKLQRSCNL
jgi:hypothetical protein